MTTPPTTKALLHSVIYKAIRYTLTKLPFDLKDQAKATRMQAVARDVSNRTRNASVAVIVLELPKEKL